MSSAMDLSDYERDPRLFLFTSLTAGSSHIITATSRMELILKANKIPFQAIDLATDEKARRLWQRRAQKKKLPGLVKDGFVLGDLEEVEEWNEFGELKENIGPVPANNAPASSSIKGVNTAPPIDHNAQPVQKAGQSLMKPIEPSADDTRIALPGAAEIAAMNKAKREQAASAVPAKPVATQATQKEEEATSDPVSDPPAVETISTAPTEKKTSIHFAKEISQSHPSLAHLSAPASAIQSGTGTPQTDAGTSTHSPSGTNQANEVKDVSVVDTEKVEEEKVLSEGTGDGENETAKGVEDLEISEE